MNQVLNNSICYPGSEGFKRFYLPGLFFLLLLSVLFSLSQGPVPMNIKAILKVLLNNEHHDLTREIIFNLRLPRALMGALVGGALALCGVVMQAVVRNPLATPYLMGVSSGASLGATTYLLFIGGAASMGLAGSAFLGALVSSILVFGVAVYSKASVYRLLLAGIAVNVLCSSLSSLMIFLSYDAQQLQMITFWLMGSLVPASWEICPWPAAIIFIGGAFFCTQWKNLNLIMLGDDDAYSLGINPQKYRLIYLIAAALISSSTVAYFGMISFVGIIIPHILRFLIGGDHRRLVPYACLAGAIFMVWVDVIARTLTNSEIPIGIITGLAGSPFFFWLLLRPERG